MEPESTHWKLCTPHRRSAFWDTHFFPCDRPHIRKWRLSIVPVWTVLFTKYKKVSKKVNQFHCKY